MIKVSLVASLVASLAMLVAVVSACDSSPESPCDYVKCGYGSSCRVDEDNNPECVCPSICSFIFSPVCGSDGKTYSNRCELNIATCKSKGKITLKENGKCPPLLPICPVCKLPPRLCPRFACRPANNTETQPEAQVEE